VKEVVVRSALKSTDYLSIRAEPWNDNAGEYYEGPKVEVELVCGGLRAKSVLPAYIADAERLGPLFHDINGDWRGWEGAKLAGVADRDWLSVAATHDGKGHVELTISLSNGSPGTSGWSARGTLSIDLGSAAAIATDLDEWLDEVWPAEHRWREPA
jgi:hypothetical protein